VKARTQQSIKTVQKTW